MDKWKYNIQSFPVHNLTGLSIVTYELKIKLKSIEEK